MIGSYLGTLLLFCSFVSICLSSNDLEEIYDVKENKEFFAKKSLDLYNKETKRLKMLPKSLDFAYFMFYDNSLEVVADSIQSILKQRQQINMILRSIDQISKLMIHFKQLYSNYFESKEYTIHGI
ncbi:hypothetical protein CWI36_0374p0020 [Hamiltosporidium magnivora]|uniref:Uncharacterized protein n=1 Tax=Hamiltosporidium magnivora TaxID=148818 RepID=A0A4Q9LFL2_9MICR|nr:hypothetical protein CWI36_0374p0020 [Hamiltosporidium magnivora]